MTSTDPKAIKPDLNGHRTRFSDSSLYDEVCVLCGATDAAGDNRLKGGCPKAIKDDEMTSDESQAMEDAMEAVSAPSSDELQSIEQLVNRSLQLMTEIESVEEYLKKMKAELHVITSTKLVDALASAGTTKFETKDVTVKIADFISGSLPKEEDARRAALNWIESVDAADLIKNHMEVDFDRKQDNMAAQVEELLEELGIPFERKRDIHHGTLKKFAKERIEKGEEVPLEKLGLYAGRAAEIKLVKKK